MTPFQKVSGELLLHQPPQSVSAWTSSRSLIPSPPARRYLTTLVSTRLRTRASELENGRPLFVEADKKDSAMPNRLHLSRIIVGLIVLSGEKSAGNQTVFEHPLQAVTARA